MVHYKIVQVSERKKFYDNELDYVEKMEIIMNEQAEAGYRLHTVLSSDKVSKSISFDGNVSPQTTMIFEKL